MRNPRGSNQSLWQALRSRNSSKSFISGLPATVNFNDLIHGTIIQGGGEALKGRSVLVSTKDHFTAALVLMELDGIARRLVLCPPGLPPEHVSFVIRSAAVDAIVSDQTPFEVSPPKEGVVIQCDYRPGTCHYDRGAECQTEWILLTSGTTGRPKLVVHTLASLTGAIDPGTASDGIVWSTFYDIRRYGGLQIFLRAILTGTSLVLPGAQETTAAFLARAGDHWVTHISGTPSHWRRALMDPSARLIGPKYVRLSGEIADQAILDNLRSFYRNARISHAFASTEGGVAFEVTDGLAGFPAAIMRETPDVEMKLGNDSLRIRSGRTAERYLEDGDKPLRDEDGFVDTVDVLELRGDRYYFTGRRDGIINVGGLKVHPEEVEAVINQHPGVGMSLVRGRRNSITGAIVVADVVAKANFEGSDKDMVSLRRDILLTCRETLPPHKVPAMIQFVTSLPVGETGKLVRAYG